MTKQLTYYVDVYTFGRHFYLDGDCNLCDDMPDLTEDGAYLIYEHALKEFDSLDRVALRVIDERGKDELITQHPGLRPWRTI